MNIQIRSQVNDIVLFEHNCENNSMRLTMEPSILEMLSELVDLRVAYADAMLKALKLGS